MPSKTLSCLDFFDLLPPITVMLLLVLAPGFDVSVSSFVVVSFAPVLTANVHLLTRKLKINGYNINKNKISTITLRFISILYHFKTFLTETGIVKKYTT